MPTFFRSIFDEIIIKLRSDETLGMLDGAFIEDYFGNPGQITLMFPDSTRVPLLMNEVPTDTPLVPHDSFLGVLELADIPNGLYRLEGRVRDVVGNYTIINEVATPLGNERIVNLEFTIAPGNGIVIDFGPLVLMGGVNFAAPMTTTLAIEHTPILEFNAELRTQPVGLVSMFPITTFAAPFIMESDF